MQFSFSVLVSLGSIIGFTGFSNLTSALYRQNPASAANKRGRSTTLSPTDTLPFNDRTKSITNLVDSHAELLATKLSSHHAAIMAAAQGGAISKRRKFVADGVFYAELNEFFQRELAEEGYSGVEVRVTPTVTDISNSPNGSPIPVQC